MACGRRFSFRPLAAVMKDVGHSPTYILNDMHLQKESPFTHLNLELSASFLTQLRGVDLSL
jgi:hypothetical protein